jgi:hypothetical protein
MKIAVVSSTVTRKVFVLFILIGAIGMTLFPVSAQADPYDGYLMAHFTGESAMDEQIYFATSTDGLHWTDVNNSQPVLISNVGEMGVRDPALIRSADGTRFWIIATDLRMASGISWDTAMHRGSTSLVIWESSDLVNWSQPRLVNVAGSIPSAGCAWAPEAIYDEANGNYVVYWATISPLDGYDKPRIYYATTTDFVTFSVPQMYIDRPGSYGIIDTEILKAANGTYQYYRASRDTYMGYDAVTIEGSNSIFGSWITIGDIHNLISVWTEGPILYKFNDVNQWCLMVDKTAGGYVPLVSTDLSDMGTYRVLGSSEYNLGANRKRHGSILSVTAAELSAIQAKWPPAAVYPADVIASYNFPTYFFTHKGLGNQARIESLANTLNGGQWNIVPGLKDPAGISFESVEIPGCYLRHYSYVLNLNLYDYSDTFKQDATFYITSGWAGSGTVSFQSYNFPTRYIRHSNYGLRIDEVNAASSSALKADATFNVTINPPVAPASLTATAGIGHVNLNWDNNIESDLAGYDIYRSQTAGGPYTLIQNVTTSVYLDNTVDNGTRYYYAVIAKDTSGNMSGNSNEDGALPPDLTDDDKIDLEDLAEVAHAWLTAYDISDLSVIAENWLAY